MVPAGEGPLPGRRPYASSRKLLPPRVPSARKPAEAPAPGDANYALNSTRYCMKMHTTTRYCFRHTTYRRPPRGSPQSMEPGPFEAPSRPASSRLPSRLRACCTMAVTMTAAPPATVAPLIEIRDLTKTYAEGGREHAVLRGAAATVRRGELVVLLGRSGSGKSTLLNLLAGIDLPTAGEVVVDGIPLSRLRERERTLFRRDHIGFVFQFYNLIPTLTVEENLLLPLELQGRAGTAGRQGALALLAEVGLADRAASFPDRLSGGEQQRLAVARALVHDPPLVLADEPTGNLDLETGLQVLELLDRLTRRAGKTMVMVTHSLEVVGLADRVLRIESGRLVEDTAGTEGAGGAEASAGAPAANPARRPGDDTSAGDAKANPARRPGDDTSAGDAKANPARRPGDYGARGAASPAASGGGREPGDAGG